MIARRQLLAGGALALGLPATATGAGVRAAELVRYPQSEPAGRGRAVPYPLRLLELALSGERYTLQASPMRMVQNRALAELQAGRVVDVFWTMTSVARERELLPVRIPLDMGLIGWRLLLIRQRDQRRFGAIRDAAGLRALDALQGHDWPDTDILKANRYRVQSASDYAGMFRMLSSGRVDYFPRAVFEVWHEAAAFADQGLVVAPGLALHYPSAFYYFVRNSNHALASAIERGLERMLADGSYQRLFDDYFGAVIARSKLAERRVFELHNPLLPAATPLARSEWWYRPR